MPLYIPWLTETIKKRGVRYLLHHYLGQFFEEKLTLEQLSIDIYEGKGSIRNLSLDVDGLNDELDFIPFRFLEGCLIGQISVEVPWSSLATDACKVELDGAEFYCRLKTSADSTKPHCTESTLLNRSLMTSSMQMAEEIVTTEDDEESETSMNHHSINNLAGNKNQEAGSSRKDANQMFEGLEMFAQLIDSVLRRTKLTAHNTLFQIKPYNDEADEHETTDSNETNRPNIASSSRSSCDEFSEPMAKSDIDDEDHDEKDKQSKNTVEFFIRFFRCEEMIDQTRTDSAASSSLNKNEHDNDGTNKSPSAIPETITKILTLEDVEMRIDGIPVSNLVGKHTITIKFNGQKSEISIFSGSPLLAVISHRQLQTFFNVFDGVKDQNSDANFLAEKDQKLMSPEDYAKIENQLLESASFKNAHSNDLRSTSGSFNIGGHKSVIADSKNSYYGTTQVLSGTGSGARRWVESGDVYSDTIYLQSRDSEYGYHSHCSSNLGPQCVNDMKQSCETTTEPTLDHIEAFSCELKLPGIWLCILRDGESLPPLIKPFADSINSFQSVNKYIDSHIKSPHLRLLALKVALDITASGINIFLGDLDISEYLEDATRISPVLKILNNDQGNVPMSSSRYKATITNGKDITIELRTKTRLMFDPTIIDRIVYDYKLVKSNRSNNHPNGSQPNTATMNHQQRSNHTDINLTIRADQFKVELLCPIPDLTPEASMKRTQLRPQSFIFDFKNMNMTWRLDRLNISSDELMAFVKTQPKQLDSEAVKFIESTCKGNDKIVLSLEPSPSNLDNDFTNDIEQALNESSMYESIYVGQATESRIPTEPFQTKRKVVRASFQSQQTSNKPNSARISECDHEKIITPGDRQHLLEYLDQTVMSTKLSLNLHLPVCEVEFEDKEQLDLIYNRFGNDFVFWQPRAFSKPKPSVLKRKQSTTKNDQRDRVNEEPIEFRPVNQYGDHTDGNQLSSDADNEGSDVSYHSMSHKSENKTNSSDFYDNEVTCKVIVDELYVRFNHQSCAAALKQEISAANLLLGVVIDINRKPNTMLSLVADNLELSNELETVLESNLFCNKESIFGLTAEIKRPTKSLKDIKLAIQLTNGLFNDFRTETYARFWQSINVTDEPIMGYVAPQIITELHIYILNTGLLLVREGARPALLSIDELYLTSMVMEQTSQIMIRLIADEVSLYMKRDRQGQEIMKNYICLVDSGLIDLDVKFGGGNRIEFGVINNVITVRVCQDSLSALCKLFNVLVKSTNQNGTQQANGKHSMASTSPSDAAAAGSAEEDEKKVPTKMKTTTTLKRNNGPESSDLSAPSHLDESRRDREMDLLVDAMNDYTISSNHSCNINGQHDQSDATFHGNNVRSDDGDQQSGRDDFRVDKARQSDQEEVASTEDDDDSISESDEEVQNYDQDYDSDGPPVFQPATSTHDEDQLNDSSRQRRPSTCLLDESNPMLANLFSKPLMPMDLNSTMHNSTEQVAESIMTASKTGGVCSTKSDDQMKATLAMDESSFFVIGDDDIGAGIIDKKQHEPLVRKLINEPINMVENHFKMKRPRTIPEALAASLERYVLEEMTLVINLYGGRDFDDENANANEESSSSTTIDPGADQALEATNELLDTISVESQLMRSRAGSMAGGQRQPCGEFSSGSLKRNSLGSSSGGRLGRRRKHLSEGSGAPKLELDAARKTVEQRVRFGEGAVNLWESLDLMSAPDFLGSRHDRLSQPVLSSDSKQAGGIWRENDVCIQLTLSKVKLLYELADGSAAPVSSQSASTNNKTADASQVDSNLTPPISWRFMLFIQDIEVKDRIAASDINKMLYEYCNESMPKRSTQMLTIKNIATINSSDGCEECDLRVSLKPLRLNIDQDTLLFLIEFFTTFCKSLTKQQSIYAAAACSATAPSGNVAAGRSSLNPKAGPPVNPSHQVSDSSLGVSSKKTLIGCREEIREEVTRYGLHGDGKDLNLSGTQVGGDVGGTSDARRRDSSSSTTSSSYSLSSSSSSTNLNQPTAIRGSSTTNAMQRQEPQLDECPTEAKIGTKSNARKSTQRSITITKNASDAANSTGAQSLVHDDTPLPTHCHTGCDLSGSANQQPIYIKSFTFSPDVPIRIDYHAKHLNFEQGALAGILMGLAHLDHSELILRRVQAKHGMRGLDRVLVFAINSWLSDIKRNQLPSILGGVGPMHSVIQLFQGLRDLVWMPIDHYRKDGRLVRGLQRGATSFSSSTAMAAINLVNRFISIVQCTAQIAHDIVTPPTMGSSRSSNHRRRSRPHRSGQSVSSLIGGGSDTSLSGSRRRHHYGHSAQHHQGHLEGGSRLHELSMSASSSAHASGHAGGLNQPRNFCEGVAVGFTILKEGFNDTARNVTVGMQTDDMRSAVGELVRQIPSTLLNPIISATEGAQSVLVGIRNQIAPDARRDDQEKWKGKVRGK